MSEFEQRQHRTHNTQLVRPAYQERANVRHVPIVNPLLNQQHILGNQAVQQFTRSCPLSLPDPSLCPTGGACHACPVVQTKLKIGQPGDQYEQEADRVAEQVMQMPEPRIQRQSDPEEEEEEETLQTKPLADQITPLIQRQSEPEEEKEEEEEPLQTKAISGHNTEVSPNVQAKITALRGGGQPLPWSVRQFFEPRFGYDFSQVRVHTDNRAVELAQTVNSRAFTVGQNIIFGMKQYSPKTRVGQRLLAHELTHVIQQGRKSGSLQKKRVIAQPGTDLIQRAAPAAGLTIGAAAVACAIGAIFGMLIDYGLERFKAWRKDKKYRHNWCRTILSAILGCLGGISVKLVETYMISSGVQLSSGPILGKILQWLVAKTSIFFPQNAVTMLLKLGCINKEQAEAITR